MTEHDRLLSTAHVAVDHAVTLFNETTEHQFTPKGDQDYATQTDFRIERELRDRLAKVTPDIGFLGEETGHSGSHDRWWCLDPIDGTVNYVHGSPLCGISLALVEEDEPKIGVVDLPRLDNRYWATPTSGAYRNGERIHVSDVSRLTAAVALRPMRGCWPYSPQPAAKRRPGPAGSGAGCPGLRRARFVDCPALSVVAAS